jgi:hypothetical protein
MVGAFYDTNRCFPADTEVTFRSNLLPIKVSLDRPIRADHDAHPASDTLLPVVKDGTRFFIPVKSAAHTGLQAIRFFTMAALEAKRDLSLFLHEDTRKGSGILFLKDLENILRLGVLHQAVDLAETTSDADFLFDENSFHTINFELLTLNYLPSCRQHSQNIHFRIGQSNPP